MFLGEGEEDGATGREAGKGPPILSECKCKDPYLPAQQGAGCHTALAGPGEGFCGRAWLPSGKASSGILKLFKARNNLEISLV